MVPTRFAGESPVGCGPVSLRSSITVLCCSKRYLSPRLSVRLRAASVHIPARLCDGAVGTYPDASVRYAPNKRRFPCYLPRCSLLPNGLGYYTRKPGNDVVFVRSDGVHPVSMSQLFGSAEHHPAGPPGSHMLTRRLVLICTSRAPFTSCKHSCHPATEAIATAWPVAGARRSLSIRAPLHFSLAPGGHLSTAPPAENRPVTARRAPPRPRPDRSGRRGLGSFLPVAGVHRS